ncbi:hypothetical protein BC831DRAFT_455440, partial [Entophlyctis helioformis]
MLQVGHNDTTLTSTMSNQIRVIGDNNDWLVTWLMNMAGDAYISLIITPAYRASLLFANKLVEGLNNVLFVRLCQCEKSAESMGLLFGHQPNLLVFLTAERIPQDLDRRMQHLECAVSVLDLYTCVSAATVDVEFDGVAVADRHHEQLDGRLDNGLPGILGVGQAERC